MCLLEFRAPGVNTPARGSQALGQRQEKTGGAGVRKWGAWMSRCKGVCTHAFARHALPLEAQLQPQLPHEAFPHYLI